jgi:cytochrome c553
MNLFWRYLQGRFGGLIASVFLLLTSVGALAAIGEIDDNIDQRLKACLACHGAQGKASSDGYFPRIAGKPEGYLYHELLNFRDGRRQYPAMSYMVRYMPDGYLHEIAHYFASQHPPYPAPESADASAAVLARGEQLVHNGDAARHVPACVACHGAALTGALPATPGLLGLPHDYLFAQLANWQSGTRQALKPDCMAEIAKRLSSDDLRAAAAWLSTQPVPEGAVRAATLPATPPAHCGSFTQ